MFCSHFLTDFSVSCIDLLKFIIRRDAVIFGNKISSDDSLV